MDHILLFQTVLYVSDQEASCIFYRNIFRKEPELHVPGMTEFRISKNCKLGLMPNRGIAKILNGKTPDPGSGNGIPRCELYLHVTDIEAEFNNALRSGAGLISPILLRDWGHSACYFSDPDGHIIAFASAIERKWL
ncbi:MAG: lactoylglutathione lyase [Bacteroidia bacterium]|nr:lactoylglutathione lyase [Bacteroidia bacterium]